MNPKNLIFFVVYIMLLVVGIGIAMGQEGKQGLTQEYRLSFDNLPSGSLPKGWKADAANSNGKLAEWKIITDSNASSKPNVLSITKTANISGGLFGLFGSTFNLCWTPDIVFQDGAIEVKIRANTGKEDQGGGIIWRVKDANNYYIARYNPLERNFRLYYVKDGRRKALATADNIDIKTGEWFTMKIVHSGDKIEGWLNGKKLLLATDRTFMKPGGVGLWTKADAVTYFDDFKITPINKFAQKLLERLALSYREIARISIHFTPKGSSDNIIIACTDEQKIGKLSDPEDLKVLVTGGTVLLKEGNNFDITMPIRDRQNKIIAVTGITLKGLVVKSEKVALGRAKVILKELGKEVDSEKKLEE